MKKFITCLLPLFLVHLLPAQNCNYQLKARVTAESGLTLRAKPSLSAEVLAYVPAHTYVMACARQEGKLVIEGLAGHWRPVKYLEHTGYMFDGFLSLPAQAAPRDNLDSLRQRSKDLIRQSDSLLGNKLEEKVSAKTESSPENGPCNYQQTATVNAPSGLSFRAQPDLNAELLATAHHNAQVLICQQTAGKLSVGKIQGFWRPVMYQGRKGYMFDGYLSLSAAAESGQDTPASSAEAKESRPQPADLHPWFSGASKMQLATEAYNYCGDVQNLDPGLLWYGIYPEKENDEQGLFRIMPVELEIKLSKNKLSTKMEFDIATESEERSLFLIGLNRRLQNEKINIEDHSEAMRIKGNRVFPGQSIMLGQNVSLAATGSIESTGDCPELKNYRLMVKSGTRQQDLLQEIGASGACGMPDLYWYGDLSGDGLPEMIFVSVYENRNVFTLLKSKPVTTEKVVERIATFTVDNCTEQ